MKSRQEGVAYVLKAAKEQNVRFIRLWFTDILSSLKSFAITVAELEAPWEKGLLQRGTERLLKRRRPWMLMETLRKRRVVYERHGRNEY